jgi:hypothetical protein
MDCDAITSPSRLTYSIFPYEVETAAVRVNLPCIQLSVVSGPILVIITVWEFVVNVAVEKPLLISESSTSLLRVTIGPRVCSSSTSASNLIPGRLDLR